MSCDWPSVRLGELADITSSKRIKRADYVTSGVPFFRSKEVIERSKGNDISTELFISEEQFSVIRDKFGAPEAGDILLTSVGTLGVPYQVRSTDRFYFKDGNLTWLRKFKESVLPEYVLYWLRSPVAQRKLDEVSIGSTQRALTIVALKSVEIPLPPKAVQARIVDMAMSLDQKLETNRNINQTLEQIAQAIFKSWFVDFEPVKAKIAALEAGGSEEDALLAAMQTISGKGEAELTHLQAEQPEQYTELRTTAKLFPSAIQDSELGEIPEGWAYGTLSDIASFSNNRIPKHELTLETYISTENMLENKKGVCPASSLPSSASVPGFELGEILISNIRPYFKKIWLANISGGRSPDVLGFSPKQKGTNEHLFNLLYQDGFFDYMMLTSKGAKMPRGDKKAVMQFTTVVPPIDLMRHFSGRVKSFYALATSHNRESKSLVSVRDTILPKLLSGELSIKGAGDQVPKAAELANV